MKTRNVFLCGGLLLAALVLIALLLTPSAKADSLNALAISSVPTAGAKNVAFEVGTFYTMGSDGATDDAPIFTVGTTFQLGRWTLGGAVAHDRDISSMYSDSATSAAVAIEVPFGPFTKLRVGAGTLVSSARSGTFDNVSLHAVFRVEH